MVEGKTGSGFSFRVDEDALKDFMYLRHLNMAQSKDGHEALRGMCAIISDIMGTEEQEEAFYSYLKERNNGHVPVDVLTSEMKDIIAVMREKSEDIKKS